MSARCLQAQGLLTISKGYETFCPMGPWMVTKDEIPDPQQLWVKTYINEREVCVAHTSEMLFDVEQFIAALSRVFPLDPGDVLATGSPPRAPACITIRRCWRSRATRCGWRLKSIGVLANPVVAAQR